MRLSTSVRHALLASAVVATLLPLAAHAADPTIASPPASPAPVTITDNGQSWLLDNGIVKATISKRDARMPSLVYKGINTMGGGGNWEQAPSGTVTQTVTIDPATNNGQRAEVAVKGVGGRGLDMEFRYTLAQGESGIHVTGIYTHHAGTPGGGEGESRYITKLNHDFNWISVDKDRNMLECTPEDWGAGVVVHAKEQRILSTGYYKNSVEHKYSYNAIQYTIPAWGWSSTKDHIGVYMINPTTEYLGGGSSKMELVDHYDAGENPDPIILNYWSAGHYGGGASANVPANEEWTKVIGPMFVYCNSLDNPDTASPQDLATLEATAGNPTVPPAWKTNADVLFNDALAQAKKEKAAWPYDWLNGVDYPHKDHRATVTGQLVLSDPQAPTTKLPHLTVGLAHPDYPGRNQRSGNDDITWDHDANYYQFWNDGNDDGTFTLTNVRPGHYTLHAYADGVLGEFAKTDITVDAGKPLDLGKLTWTPLRLGKQLWEIGYPDRTGDKFFKGDADNYWLWGWPLRYPLLFPNDVNYTIGKSDYHKDWFFEETPHSESTAWLNPDAKDPANQRFGWVKAESVQQYPHTDSFGPWGKTYGNGRATTWTIHFTMPAAEHGQAALRIALAGSDSTAGLSNPGGRGFLTVGVNGGKVGDVQFISTNAIRYNTNRGVWRQYIQPFDASLLKAGDNTIELTVPAGEVTSGVVYDYLRLELNENAQPNAPVPDPMKP